MLRRVTAAALCVLHAQVAWGLDAPSQQLADRYAAILTTNPGHDAAFERLWKIYESAGETPALVAQARKSAAAQPVLTARILERSGAGAEARKILEPLAGKNAEAARMLAGWMEKSGQADAAAGLLEKTGKQMSNAGLLLAAAEIRARAGQADKARSAWEQAIKLEPKNLELRRKAAAGAARAGDVEAASGHLKAIAENGTPAESLAAWEEISQLQEGAGKLDQAIAAQERVREMLGQGHWKAAATEERLFHLYEAANRLPEMEAELQRDAEARPDDPAASRRLAAFYEARGDAGRQLEWLRKTTALQPEDIALLRATLGAEYAGGHIPEATALADRIIALAPGDQDASFLRAELAAVGGDAAEAERQVSLLLKATPDDESLKARAKEFYERQRLMGPLEAQLVAEQARRPSEMGPTLELAQYYLDERRFVQAEKALDRLDLKNWKPEEAAGAALQIARLLQEAKIEEGALRWAERSLTLNPGSLEAAIETAGLLAALKRNGDSASLLAKAGQASLTALPPAEVDRRFFAALEATQKGPEAMEDRVPSPATREMLAALQKHAVSSKQENAWLRLSRWRDLSGNPIAAEESLLAGLKAHPDSSLLTEALADHFATEGDADHAIKELEKLGRISPERMTEVKRRIGRLEIDRGRADDAQKIFEEIQSQNKSDWQAAADVATAQQAGENWFPAMDKWIEAYELAPADARRSLLPSVLAVASRLRLYERALNFLEKAAEDEKDTQARNDIFREAAIFAVEQKIGDLWREELQRRSDGAPGERHWKLGLAALLKEEGRNEEARALLATEGDAQSRPAMEALLKSAEQAGDMKEALRLAQEIARREKSGETALRYAGLLERAGRQEEAAVLYASLTTPFARDRSVLVAAGDFFERQGDIRRAEDYYRKAAGLGALAAPLQLKLGRLAIGRQDRDLAAKDFETLLATSRPDLQDEKIILPLPTGLNGRVAQMPEFWARPSDTETQGCRLLAIQELGKMLVHSPTKKNWAESFNQPNERIWASYFSGDRLAALDKIEALAEGGDEQTGAVYAALALDAGQIARITNWASMDIGRSAARWEVTAMGMRALLKMGRTLNALELAALCKNAPAVRRWEIARDLASRGYLRQARDAAEGVPGTLPDAMAAQAWIEYSNWCIALRDATGARQALDQAIAIPPRSASYTEPMYAALRARWLLTPKAERAAFEQQAGHHIASWKQKDIERASLALLASLQGKDTSAEELIKQLYANDDLSSQTQWTDRIQQSGRLLEQWGLTRLARDLYRRYLSENSILNRLDGEDFRDVTEGLLATNKLMDADAASTAYLVSAWSGNGASQDEMLQAARRLSSSLQKDKSEALLQKVCQQPPASDSVLGGVLTFTQDTRMSPLLQRYVEQRLRGPVTALGKTMINNAGVRLATQYQQQGLYEEAMSILGRLDPTSSAAPAILLQRAQLLVQMGKFQEAISLLEKQPSRDGAASLMLADLYTRLGRTREASGILLKLAATSGSTQVEAAIQLRRLASLTGDSPALAKASLILKEKGEPAADSEWGRRAEELNRRFLDRRERFQAGSQFLTENPQLPPAIRAAELGYLKSLATQDPALAASYYALRKTLATQLNATDVLERELVAEWAGGAGAYFAGEILLQLYLDKGQTADIHRVLGQYLTDANYRPTAWRAVAAELLKQGRAEPAERVLTALANRTDGDAGLDLMMAEALWKQGKPNGALVEPVEQIAQIDTERHLDLARYYLALGLADIARDHLQQIPEGSQGALQAGDVWAELLNQEISRGHLSAARATIAMMAGRYPDKLEGKLVADYADAAGELEKIAPTDNPFQFGENARREWQLEAIERLAARQNSNAAFQWIEKNPRVLGTERGRAALLGLEQIDMDRAIKIWDGATSQASLWETRTAAAQAHMRRALVGEKANALKDLEAAQKLDPGNFRIVRASVEEYVRLGRTKRGIQAIETALKSYSSPEDRVELAKLLEGLKTSPTLPRNSS